MDILNSHAEVLSQARNGQITRRSALSSYLSDAKLDLLFPHTRASESPFDVSSANEKEPENDKEEPRMDVKPQDSKSKKIEGWGDVYVPGEDSIRNNYSQHYVNTGKMPQNFISNASLDGRFSEYPKLKQLLSHKRTLLSSQSIPPTYISQDSFSPSLSSTLLTLLPTRFDAILITPPPTMTFEQLAILPIDKIAAVPSFVWIWVGDGAETGIGLEKGRELLLKWGFRRCEDIVWVKPNPTSSSPLSTSREEGTSTLFTHSKEHCLMGIKGTVRRSTDGWMVHCNIDTDVIVWTPPLSISSVPSDIKPPEMYTLVENFCNGTRRLDLFGNNHTVRRGWLTIGDIDASQLNKSSINGGLGIDAREYIKESFDNHFVTNGYLLPPTSEIDLLRPRSPTTSSSNPSNPSAANQRDSLAPKGLGRGRGAPVGVNLMPGGAPMRRGVQGQGRGGPTGSGSTPISGGVMLGARRPNPPPPQQQQHGGMLGQGMGHMGHGMPGMMPQGQMGMGNGSSMGMGGMSVGGGGMGMMGNMGGMNMMPDHQMNMMPPSINMSMPATTSNMSASIGGPGIDVNAMMFNNGNMGMGMGGMGGMGAIPGMGGMNMGMGMGNMGNMSMGTMGMGNMGGMGMGNMSMGGMGGGMGGMGMGMPGGGGFMNFDGSS